MATGALVSSLAAVVDESVAHGFGQLPGTAFGHRETDGLAKHDQQRAQETRASSIERNVGVQGVSGQEQLRPVTAERVAEQGRGGVSMLRTNDRPPTLGSLARALNPGPQGAETA